MYRLHCRLLPSGNAEVEGWVMLQLEWSVTSNVTAVSLGRLGAEFLGRLVSTPLA